MANKLFTHILLLLLPFFAKSQTQDYKSDSLKKSLEMAANDTIRMYSLYNLADYYLDTKRDTSLIYIEQGITIADKIEQPIWKAQLFLSKAYVVGWQWDFRLKFKLCNQALAILEEKKNEKNVYIPHENEFANMPEKYRLGLLADVYVQLGVIYGSSGDVEKCRQYCQDAVRVTQLIKSYRKMADAYGSFAELYYHTGKLDSCLIYSKKVLECENISRDKFYTGHSLQLIGKVYSEKNQKDSARYYYNKALSASKENNITAEQIYQNLDFAQLYNEEPDSIKHYAKTALQLAIDLKDSYGIESAERWLYYSWEKKGNADSALAWLIKASAVRDSLNADKNEKLTQFQNVSFEEQNRLDKQVQEAIANKNKIRTIALFFGSGLLAVLAFIFYRNNRQKQKANLVLQNQKKEIETTLTQLKSTQTQLIQSEKMASLGELTAGIAHEIQNPLNFVNNFSEVSRELIEELKSQNSKFKNEEQEEILNDIDANLEKINHHGKRADSIVKGMLQHSQRSGGITEPTDINSLADEYLRLAYHGMRGKDSSLNVILKTNFDKSIGNINVISQDIGRVFLNLYNNAFYAVNEKKKLSQDDYEPTVLVETKKTSNSIIISVKDNGNGIPQNIVDKIFQPFFTTKPTGSGTGLGLSLAYDIVKAHGGEISVGSGGTVETKESEGSVFFISLPLNQNG